MSGDPDGDGAIDVGRLIDERPLGGFQVRIILLIALAVVIDGLDNRLLPLAIPQLLEQWHVARTAFAVATSVGLIGMTIGTVAGGMIGDRIGRRPTIVGSVLAFGLFTLANGFVDTIGSMTALRFFAGLGLGALMPSAAAMVAEFAPAARRTLAVTLGMVCIPVGGVLSGLLGALVLPAPGWRALFIVGGGLAIAVALVQAIALPESPRFLARTPGRRDALDRLMARLGHRIDGAALALDDPAAGRDRQSVARLFAGARAVDTIGIWGAFFAILLCLYMESQWMPTLLSNAGYDLRTASVAGACLAFGGIFACIVGVAAVDRFGSRVALVGMALAGAIVTLALARYPLDPARPAAPLLLLLTVVGFLVGGLQIMIYAVAAHIYPPHLRGTGIGWAVGVGRLGSVISPFVATAAIGGGWPTFFVTLAGGMAIVAAALIVIRHHVPPRAAV